MKPDIKNRVKKLMSKKHAKLAIAVGLICIAAIGVFAGKTILGAKKNTSVQNTAAVKKGDLKITVTGSGPVYSTNESKLYAQIGATVTKVNYKAGDVVKKGDVIAEFDDTDYQNTLANNENSLLQNQLADASSAESYNNLIIKAPFSGQVSSISVSPKDEVKAGDPVLTISDTSKLKVTLSFNASDAANIAVGQSADVYLTSLMESVSGTVFYVSNKPTTTANGGLVYTVEIKMNNPGAISEGASASADINTGSGTVSSTGTGLISYISKQTVASKVAGTVKSVYVSENQNVSGSAVLVTLTNNDLLRAKETSGLKVAASENQVNSSLNQSSRYKIVAPCDGTVTVVNNKVGDTVKAGDEIADIYDPNQMQFDVNVDELDIAKLAVGQDVNITLDAISNTTAAPMTGKISKIAVVGTSTNGVTTYPVTIQFDGDVSQLKGGMNANGEIIVNQLKNVLYVPLEAVSTSGTKKYVWVNGNGNKTSAKSSSGGKNSSYYANAVRKEVTVGDNNDTYIVIKSGLSEADTVILPQTTSSTGSNTSTSRTSGGVSGSRMGGGGFGGGM